jgi:tetratricopeptide (TPR) repeat protein
VAGLDLAQALADCNESLRLSPDNGETLDSRGLVHLKMGSFAQALADYDAALRQDTKNAHWLYGRGLAKARTGDTAGGEADMAEAKSIRTDIGEVYAGYGVK